MEYRHFKDFTIAAIVVMVIVFGFTSYKYFTKASKVPFESKYKKMALSDKLLTQIKNIELSIQDRMNFTFTAVKDPLEQNLIVKTQVDLENQWKKRVEAMMRLSATYHLEDGKTYASIDYKGNSQIYKVGDSIEGNKILAIKDSYITIRKNGINGKLKLQAIPEKPASIKKDNVKEQELNW